MALPHAEMYERSYMHRDVVTHTCVAPQTDFVITGSADGHVKFWKKMPEDVEFVKHYFAHLGPINALVCSSNGQRLCSTGEDKAIKFYDVVGFDMNNIINVDFVPTAAVWVGAPGTPQTRVAVADKDTPTVRIYRCEGEQSALHQVIQHP